MNEIERQETNAVATDDSVVVFDIPVEMTAEQTAQLIIERQESGAYFMSGVLPWPGVGARVFLRRPAAKQAFGPSAEARATTFLRENREMPIPQLVAAFKALGFIRNAAWITKKRDEIIATERAAMRRA